MNHTPLEDQVHDSLHRTAAPLERAPFTVGDVRTRARQIQRRRTAAAGAAVAAVLAIAVPVGLSTVGPAQRSEVPPATQPPTPQLATGTVLVDPRSADTVDRAPVPLMDVDGPSLITPDGTIDLPKVYDTLTPYRDGWLGVAVNDAPDLPFAVIEVLDADLEVVGGGSATGGLAVRPDGQRVAWSEYDGERWQVVLADTSGGAEPVRTAFPPAPESHRVEPVGFVSEDEVAVRQFDDTLRTATYVVGSGRPVEVPGLLQAESSSPASGVVAGLSRITRQESCSAVVGASAPAGGTAWETCDHRLGAFSPSGAYVVGLDPESDGNGSPTVTVLDAATGEEVVTFEAVLPPRTVGGFWTQMAWEGDEALVVRMWQREDYHVMRLGLDGTVRRIDIPGAGVSGLSVAVPG